MIIRSPSVHAIMLKATQSRDDHLCQHVRHVFTDLKAQLVGSFPLHIWEGDWESWLWCITYNSADVPHLLPDVTMSPTLANYHKGWCWPLGDRVREF